MSAHLNTFIDCLRARRKVRVTYVGLTDGMPRTRVCAPLDVGPSRGSVDGRDRLHLWDYDGAKGPHLTSILLEQVVAVEDVGEGFEPGEIITWTFRSMDWHLSRDWGGWS